MEGFYKPPKFGGLVGRKKRAGEVVEELRVINLIPATYSDREERPKMKAA